MAIHSRKSLAAIGGGITNRQPFTVASMSARWFPAGHHFAAQGITTGDAGRLPAEHRATLNEHAATSDVFAVYSYRTPIGWWTEAHGWIIPAVSYSITTSGHQKILRVETAHPVFYDRLAENIPSRTRLVPGTPVPAFPREHTADVIETADKVLARARLAEANTPDEWLMATFEMSEPTRF